MASKNTEPENTEEQKRAKAVQGAESDLAKKSLKEIGSYFESELKKWEDVEVNIGVTGKSGVGKSSFINAIRGLKRKDKNAAKTGVTETTTNPTPYRHPTNSKIIFWDMPGIGTTEQFDLQTYCENVNLETYDTFLILNSNRFSKDDHDLAKFVKSNEKTFFFVRTKIDHNYRDEKRELQEDFVEEVMLTEIRAKCLKKLRPMLNNEKDVFLISNHYQKYWDFPRLTQAILDALPTHQKECLALTLTCETMELLETKINLLRDRIWKVATSSSVCAMIPVPVLSVAVDYQLITNELKLYKSTLGLSEQFDSKQKPSEIQSLESKLFKFNTAAELASAIAVYTASSAVEEYSRFIPIIGSIIAGSISFGSTYYFLHDALVNLEKTAREYVQKKKENAVDDL